MSFGDCPEKLSSAQRVADQFLLRMILHDQQEASVASGSGKHCRYQHLAHASDCLHRTTDAPWLIMPAVYALINPAHAGTMRLLFDVFCAPAHGR
jgi:hypothetical protein